MAAALLSKMGYTEQKRIQVKLEFLRTLSRMELDPVRSELLYGFFETYLKLNDEEERRLRKEIEKLPQDEMEKVFRLPNSYYERGYKEGIEQGIEQGIEKTVYEMLKNRLAVELISKITHLSIDKIEKMKKEWERSN